MGRFISILFIPSLLVSLAYLCSNMVRMGPNQKDFHAAWERLCNRSTSISSTRIVEGRLTDARRDAWYKVSVQDLTFNQYPQSECTVFNSTPAARNRTWINVLTEESFIYPSLMGKLSNEVFRRVLTHTPLAYTLASVVRLDDHFQEDVSPFFDNVPEFLAATKELSTIPGTVPVPTWIGTFTSCQSIAKTHANVLIGVYDDLYYDRVLCTLYLRIPPGPVQGESDKSILWVNGSVQEYRHGNGTYICYNSGRLQHTGGEGKVEKHMMDKEVPTELKMFDGSLHPVKGCRMMWRWSALVHKSEAERASAWSQDGVTEAEIVRRFRELLLKENLLASMWDLGDDQAWQLLGIRNLACAPNDFLIGYVNDYRFFGPHLCTPILFVTKALLYWEWYWRKLLGTA